MSEWTEEEAAAFGVHFTRGYQEARRQLVENLIAVFRSPTVPRAQNPPMPTALRQEVNYEALKEPKP